MIGTRQATRTVVLGTINDSKKPVTMAPITMLLVPAFTRDRTTRAMRQSSPVAVIAAAMKQAAARRLYQVPLFAGIQSDIAKARAAILNGWKRTTNGSLTNAFGKAIEDKAKTVEQLAHLIQGVEAKALQAAIDLYPNDIVLLQHDGFAASTRLSNKAIVPAPTWDMDSFSSLVIMCKFLFASFSSACSC